MHSSPARLSAAQWSLAALLCLLLGPAGCSTTEAQDSSECHRNEHCEPGQRCDGQRCVPDRRPDSGATPGERCRGDGDCPNGRCVEGECFANTCAEGQERPCSTACGEGVERCRGGVWRPCTARAPTLEICGNGVDDNCDGRIDEDCGGCHPGDERPCRTECGTGVERCVDGQWYGCTAPRVRPEICGNGVDDNCDGQIDEGCDGCREGEARACETACGQGTEHCVEGSWRGCDAPMPSEEICNGLDDDCDGQIDEDTVRDCSNACGSGLERCVEGVFTGCTAPTDCACEGGQVDTQVCGQCGVHQRDCVGTQWQDWGRCVEAESACEPGDEQRQVCGKCGTQRRLCTDACTYGDWQPCLGEGVCEPGEVQTEACEHGCGQRERRCEDGCGWGEWSACVGPGGEIGCAPGEQEERACGKCGVQRRVCGLECSFGAWGPCEGEGVCQPGDEEGEACDASCSARARTCTAQCTWGEFGACSGGGQCTPGQRQTRECGQCGEQARTCLDACVWSSWSTCQGEGVCQPGAQETRSCGSDVGQCRKGVQRRNCGGLCSYGSWGSCEGEVRPSAEICGDGIDQDCNGSDLRRPDRFEPNDSCDRCSALTGVDPNVFLNASIDHIQDRDFYCFEAVDDFSLPGFSERIKVNLLNIPSGADYDLFLYRSKATCRANEPLESSTNSGNTSEHIDWVESLTGDDSGTYVVEVRRFRGHHCDREYRLEVNGLN